MKKKIAKLWIKALKSGKYQQAQNTLKSDTGFCCLGVLCDLHRKVTKKRGFDENGAYLDSTAILPQRVATWAGLSSCVGKGPGVDLMDLNDAQQKSFLEIADAIEQNVENL
jgi:hypothetical protein